MSVLCSDIITSALKLARVLPSGGTPTSNEASDGLDCLQSMYDEWVTGGMFGTLTDAYLDYDDTAQEGIRYLLASGVTLTEPTTIDDPVTGATRQPYDLSVYEKVDSGGTRTVRLYDRSAWVNLLGLVDSDAAPLASRGKIGLAACLATSGAFAAMFGDTATLNPDVRAAANRFRTSLSYKLGSTHVRTASEYF
jgi:hypothetical protein